MKRKKIINKLIFCISLFLLMIVIFVIIQHYFFNPYKETIPSHKLSTTLPLSLNLTKEQAIEDLDYLTETIRQHHMSAVNKLPDSLKQQYEYEVSQFSNSPSVLQVYQAACRIAALLKDGHTTVSITGSTSLYYHGTYFFEGDSLTMILNDETLHITQINGIDLQTIWNHYLTLTSYENSIAATYYFENNLIKKDFLLLCSAAKPTDETVKLTYTSSSETSILELPYVEKSEYDTSTVAKNTTISSDFVSYKIIPEHDVGILTLNACINNEFYQDTLTQFFHDIESKHITNIAVDLRSNPGGNSSVLNEFIKYLDIDHYQAYGLKVRYGPLVLTNKSSLISNDKVEYPYSGSVYVLTSNYTFSSAMMFSVTLQDNKIAKVIGEPSSNKPSSYGDILQFQLPNSKLLFITTFKYFTRPDSTKDAEETQIPDYRVPSEDAITKLYQLTN